MKFHQEWILKMKLRQFYEVPVRGMDPLFRSGNGPELFKEHLTNNHLEGKKVYFSLMQGIVIMFARHDSLKSNSV